MSKRLIQVGLNYPTKEDLQRLREEGTEHEREKYGNAIYVFLRAHDSVQYSPIEGVRPDAVSNEKFRYRIKYPSNPEEICEGKRVDCNPPVNSLFEFVADLERLNYGEANWNPFFRQAVDAINEVRTMRRTLTNAIDNIVSFKVPGRLGRLMPLDKRK